MEISQNHPQTAEKQAVKPRPGTPKQARHCLPAKQRRGMEKMKTTHFDKNQRK